MDWRLGAEFYEHYLLDHDFSSSFLKKRMPVFSKCTSFSLIRLANIIQWQFVADVGHQKYTYKSTGKKDKNAIVFLKKF